jgi:DNA primase
MSSPVERIKERLGIADVVSSYIQLERTGANYRARCPFHAERTPSFFVSPTRNTYYCFGCGAKGDIFSFVQQFEGLDFPGALRVLGERAGVSVTNESPEKKSERDRLFQLMDDAAGRFVSWLDQAPEARAYLSERGVSEGSIRHWRIGYAPAQWQQLTDALERKGYAKREIIKAGLAREGSYGAYDLFRGRIMFPIMDSSGRPVAFSGRSFPERDDAPKYVNTPETMLFNKSRVLYGFDKAKHSIRKLDFAIVVEGQMDMIMCHQGGYTNTVALSGTALTMEQVTTLARLSSNLVLALDADTAGINSAGRSAALALSQNMNVKVATLPTDADPADLVQAGGDAWKEVIRGAEHVIVFYLNVLADRARDTREYRQLVEQQVVPFVARMESAIDQAHFINLIADRIQVPEEAIREAVQQSAARDDAPWQEGGTAQVDAAPTQERTAGGESKQQRIAHWLVAIVRWQERLEESWIDTQSVRGQITSVIGESYAQSLFEAADDHEAVMYHVEAAYTETQQLQQSIDELLRHLEEESVRQQLSDAMSSLKAAEQEGDEETAQQWRTTCHELSRRLSALMAIDTE